MANRNIYGEYEQEWRGNEKKPPPGLRKNLDTDDSLDRIDSGLGDELPSISNEDRSSTGSDSLSYKSRDQICGTSNTGLEQKTGKLTLSDKSTDSDYYSREASSSFSETSQGTSYSLNETSKPSFVNSFAQSNDIRYLLAAFWRQIIIQNQDGDTSLHVAIINCQEKVIDAIVDVLPKKEYLDLYNYLTQTPLHLAVITRQPKVIQKLIDRGASVELPDRNGQTCVHLACQRGDLKSLKAIFKPRPDKPEIHEKLQEVLETRNFEGLTPLHVAVSVNNLEVVKELIVLGADVNAADGKSGHTALHLAVEQNNLPIVSYLLFEGNANANASSYSGCTPLHIAAGLGLKPIVATLIAAGGNLSLENSEGDTVFEIASESVEDILESPFEPMED